MSAHSRPWRQKLRDRAGPVLTDFGTVLLGAAAIFLTRAFPKSDFSSFDSGMLIASALCCFGGLMLRFIARS